jgi:catechol 2,3-dioxygenase-like lactoylglutathione lyase family enzyme
MRLNHVTIIVSNFEASKAFYTRLGLEQIVDAPPRYARFIVPGNEATFSIEVIDGNAPMDIYQAQVFFECDDLDTRVERLKAAGITFVQDPTDMPYLWREARLRDPDGHDIRLYHAGENRLNPPWRIKPALTA